jgi:hypothetical protein
MILPHGLRLAISALRRLPTHRWLLVTILFAHAVLLGLSAHWQAPTRSEFGRLGAGIIYWRTQWFGIDPGNPPLAGAIAAAPVLVFCDVGEGRTQSQLRDQAGDWALAWVTLGRWALIPMSLIGGTVCYLWANDLYGTRGGLLAAALWCTCPEVLANGQLVTGDMTAAATGVAAWYGYWRWLRYPSGPQAVCAGLLLGLAYLAKYTWILMGPLWLFVWALARWTGTPVRDGRHQLPQRFVRRELPQLAAMALLALYVIHLGYLFEAPCEPLGRFAIFQRCASPWIKAEGASEAYSHSDRTVRPTRPSPDGTYKQAIIDLEGLPGWLRLLARVPIPVPANYVAGIGAVAQVADEPYRETYLNGQRRRGGFGHYYVYGYAVKLPLGTLALFGMALLSLIGTHPRRLGDEALLVGLTAFLLVFVTLTTGVPLLRYALPSLPFAFILAGRLGSSQFRPDWIPNWLVGICLAASAASSLAIYPHSGSYFHELVGGPRHGHAHLIGSDIDWGQDLKYLRAWLDRHPEATPLRLAFYGGVSPGLVGIEADSPPHLPEPGWFAVSVSLLRGYFHSSAISGNMPVYLSYFLEAEPVAMAGYSIYIYHLTAAEADRIRAKLDLPPLDQGEME